MAVPCSSYCVYIFEYSNIVRSTINLTHFRERVGGVDGRVADVTEGGSLHDVADHELADRLESNHKTVDEPVISEFSSWKGARGQMKWMVHTKSFRGTA